MVNKKIINATPIEDSGIKFRSRLERMVYTVLIQNGFNPEYEKHKYIIWEGFRPTIPLYTRDKRKNLILQNKKLVSITYTPDFYFEYNGKKIIVEAKGSINDVFPYKFKMFRKYLEELPDSNLYEVWEVFTKKQLLSLIEKLKYEQC